MKPSERRLLVILGIVAMLCGTALLVRHLLGLQRITERRAHALGLRRMESDAMLAEMDLWKARLDWLNHHQPAMTSETQASEELLDAMLSLAGRYHLSVQKQQLHEVSAQSFYREVGVTLTLQGELPDVFRWLHSLLTPESLRLVAQLKIVPDEKALPRVLVTVRINRRHAPVVSANNTTLEGLGL